MDSHSTLTKVAFPWLQNVLHQLVKEKLLPLKLPYNKLPVDVLGSVVSDFKEKYEGAYEQEELQQKIRKKMGQLRWWNKLPETGEQSKQKYRTKAKERKKNNKSLKENGSNFKSRAAVYNRNPRSDPGYEKKQKNKRKSSSQDEEKTPVNDMRDSEEGKPKQSFLARSVHLGLQFERSSRPPSEQ
jgi:hypothetical protein